MGLTSIKLDTIRDGVTLLGQALREVDGFAEPAMASGGNGRVNSAELEHFLDQFGDGGNFDDAATRVLAYAKKRYNTSAPTEAQLMQSLAAGMRVLAKADKDSSGWLSPSEQSSLAATWGAIVAFAKDPGAIDFAAMKPAKVTGPASGEAVLSALKDAAKGKLTRASAYDPELDVFSIKNAQDKDVSLATVSALLTKWAQGHVPDGEWKQETAKNLKEFFAAEYPPGHADYDATFDISAVGDLMFSELTDLKQFTYADESGSNWVNVIVGKAQDGTLVGVRNPNLE
ncbi:MAG: hypothetical protein IT381_27920 [Deltaproteobacteria bacterium]|nr:hypothetical protein [Deltaproteobacteria bacterium]